MLRVFELEDRELDPDDPWNEFLQNCAFAIRSTFHTTLQASPGQLIFGRDVIHDIRFEANWDRIKNNKEKYITTSKKRENRNRIKNKYDFGERIILRKTRYTTNAIGAEGGSVHYLTCWNKWNG
jgi:hypothetical protein